MIIGLVLRNFKIYKNINFIPLSNGESFSGLIGANGIGKSSILEALDCFFNYRQWNLNINMTSNHEDSSYITPIFLIEKNKIVPEILRSKAEIYSNMVWELLSLTITPTILNSNFKEFVEHLKVTIKRLPSSITNETHYLLPLGEDSNHTASNSIFRGNFILDKFSYSESEMDTELSLDEKYYHIAKEYIAPLAEYVKSLYNYIFIPKDIEPQSFVQFGTNEVQILLGERLEEIISNYISKQQIQDISNNLKSFVDKLSDSIPDYKYKAPTSYQPNLKPSTIYSLIAKDFFSLRELHKESKEDRQKDLAMKHLSSGEKQQAILTLIFSIINNYRKDSSNLIIAIDEPESSLHISACYDQFEKIYLLSRKCTQVLFASHWYGFIPAMNSGVVINISYIESKYSFLMFDISKYREEIKIRETEHRKAHKKGLPIDVMLKSSNDFIQSILSSVIQEEPYNWLICEGSSELIYFNYYLKDEILENKLRIVPVGGAKEIKKAYNHLLVSFEELKSEIKGKVMLVMDTDEQLIEFDTKDTTNLYCYRIVNDTSDKETKLVKVISNPKSPKTELEDTLNGKVFYETLKEFKAGYSALLDFVDNTEKEEIPSYFALDLRQSEIDCLTSFFDDKVENKVLFSKQYIINAQILDASTPKWILEIKKKFQKTNQ